MAWTDPAQPFWSDALSNIQIVQPTGPQPVTFFQQLTAEPASPAPSLRPGHIREDLVELMMMQNAQMHQVIMNNMTMSALRSFGYTHHPEQHVSGESEDEPQVYHHHYPYAPCLPSSVWLAQPLQGPPCEFLLSRTIQSFQEPPPPPGSVCRNHPNRSGNTMRRDTTPPPLPSGTGTVRAEIPPAAEYNNAERRQ